MPFAQIETSTFCNLECWFCNNAHYDRLPNEVMPMELFEKILDEIAAYYPKEAITNIAFSAFNEPMADPLFFDRLETLKVKEYRYFGFTNGTMYDEASVDLMTRFSDIITGEHVNMPSVDREVYEELTGRKRDVSRMVDMIKLMAEKIPKQHWVLVLGDYGKSHGEEYRKACVAFSGVPNITVRKIRCANRAGTLPGGVSVDHGGKVVGCKNKKMEDLYIGVHGEVYHCCHDFSREYSFGSLRQNGFAQLYASREYKVTKQQTIEDMCNRCSQAIVKK